MKEMRRGEKEKDEVKARKDEAQNMVLEVSHPSEPERMLQDYSEAATEELSRKKNELSAGREKNTTIETRRNKKKSEESLEDVTLQTVSHSCLNEKVARDVHVVQ